MFARDHCANAVRRESTEGDERTSEIGERSSQVSRPTKMSKINFYASVRWEKKSDSKDAQNSKQRELGEPARNRARQAVAVQVPALSDKTSPVSARRTNQTPPSPRSDSQDPQRRHLAHGAQNRSRQVVVVQVPALNNTTSPLSAHRTNTKRRRRLVPTHRLLSDVSRPTALGIVPVRRLEPESLRSTTQQACCQPAAPTSNAAVASIRLTGSSAQSAGPRRSESCPSGNCRSRPCTQRHNKPARRQPTRTKTKRRRRLVPTHRSVSAVSWPTALAVDPVKPRPFRFLRQHIEPMHQ